MANYYCTIRTNYFRVTDEEKYAQLFAGLRSEDLHWFTETRDGILYHGFGSYGCIDYSPDSVDEDFDEGCIDDFFKELQKILPDDEAFIMMEAGAEKMRYVVGDVTVVTTRGIHYQNMHDWAVNEARKMLDNPDFSTRTMY